MNVPCSLSCPTPEIINEFSSVQHPNYSDLSNLHRIIFLATNTQNRIPSLYPQHCTRILPYSASKNRIYLLAELFQLVSCPDR